MGKKLNKALLNEEIKKFRLLSEYSWFLEQEEPNVGDETITNAPIEDITPEDDSKTTANAETPEGEMEKPETEITPESNEEEIDVTDLVTGSKEAKEAADSANSKTEELLKKFSDLEQRITAMDAITNKIEGLEKEIIKRNPTPVEKLEMRSLSSFPYSQKLTDYWSDKEGAYNVMGDESKEKEYVLTQDKVDDDYNEVSVRKTFDSPAKEDYTEEDI
jgi:hypothetical protein